MALGRKKGWIGVDLGPRTLKLVQVQRSRTGLRIATSVVMPRIRTSQSKPDAGAGGCEWTAGEILAALSLKTDFSGRTAACVLPMCVTDLNMLTLPPAEIAERRAMVAHELSSMFAGDTREREFDCWETQSAANADSSNMEAINVLSVPRGLVCRVADNLAGAGLSCRVMDGLPLALARAVKLAYDPGRTAPIGAVDWDSASATFCVVSDGKPLFTRHLRSCGTSRLVDAVSQALNLSEDEAVQVLVTYGLPDHEDCDDKRREIQEVIAEVTAGRLNEMAEELEKTLSYLRMQYAEILPEQLCLFGEGATVRNVAAFLSEKVGLPAQAWRMPHSENQAREHHVPKNQVPKDPEDHPALLGTAVALSALAWT